MPEKTSNKLEPLYPHVKVPLIGTDGNGMFLIAAVTSAMKNAGVPKSEIDRFRGEAMSGSYEALIQCCIKWVDVS
jgi:hypothetical protein